MPVPILYWSDLCLRNSLKIAKGICQFSQYVGTKLDMLFEIAQLVGVAIILEEIAILPLKFLISCKSSTLLLPLST